MIFAKLDVCFWRHKKFKRAGAAACGYYAAALAYLREDETTDGVLEHDVIGQLLDVGERKALEFCERLVKCELFGRHDRGYVFLGYASKNETKEQIEARRAATASRVNAHRSRVRNAVTGHVTSPVTSENVTHTVSAFVPGSDSDSVSVISLKESEEIQDRPSETIPVRPLRASDDGAFGMTCAAWADGVRSVTGGYFPVPRGKAAGDLTKALAGCMAQFPAPDECASATAAGKAYASANPGRTLDSYDFGRWLGSGRPQRPQPGVQVAPGSVSDAEATRRATEAVKRGQETIRRTAAYEREAVPAPVGDLMAAIGGKR